MIAALLRHVLRHPLLLAAALLAAALPATAHMPLVKGRLVDLTQRSDAIVIGRVSATAPIRDRQVVATVQIDRVLSGDLAHQSRLAFRASSGLASGERQVLFLVRTDSGYASVQQPGTVFPCRPEDDATYLAAVTDVHRALTLRGDAQVTALRAALIPLLSASVAELRYHAALELSALAAGGHGPTPAEQAALARWLEAPGSDPALRPIVRSVSSRSVTSPSSPGDQP